MNLTDQIKQLLAVCEEQLKDPNTDKVAVRRTRAALQSAFYISMAHYPNRSVEPSTANFTGISRPQNAEVVDCICKPGMKDFACPVHKTD